MNQTNGLLLHIDRINSVNKRKGLKEGESRDEKLCMLTHIFYKDLEKE